MMRLRISAAGLATALAATLPAPDAFAHVLSQPDRNFLERATRASLAEIELGELAKQKGMRDEVKSFATRMVEDHSRSNDTIARIAEARGVELPADLGRDHRDDMKEMKALIGPEFDRAYMKRMLEEHEEAVELFEKQAESAEDPEVRAFAKRQLAVMRGHYDAALGTHSLTRHTDREYGSKLK